MPPMPSWDAMHPLVIHFPIVLLLLVPVFAILGGLVPAPANRPYRLVGLILLILGTLSLYVAASTGEAAGELADRGNGVERLLSAHEELATKSEILFSVFSVLAAALVTVPRLLRKPESRRVAIGVAFGFVALYSTGILTLVNTAHNGGRLVHEFGVHALVPASVDSTAASAGEGKQFESRNDE